MAAIQFNVLSDSDIERINDKTLEAFEKIGIKIAHSEAMKLLKKEGAIVDETSCIVKFPRKLSKELISQIPERALRTGLNGKLLSMGGDNTFYGSLVIDPFIVDYHKGLRKPVLEDVRRNTILGEALDKISFIARMECPVDDIPRPDSYLKTMEVFLKNHTKHTAVLPTSMENLKTWLGAVDVIADTAGIDLKKTPLISLYMAVTSPLQIHEFNVEIIKEAVKKSFPVRPTVCPMAGATAPYSLAGSILIGNIEAMAAGMLTQVYRKGHPFIYASSPSVTEMKSGHDMYNSAPFFLFEAGSIQMAKHYRIPSTGCGSGSLTWKPDIQNGFETSLTSFPSIALRANEVFGIGSCHNANGMSAEHIVMNCEIINALEYLCRGVDTTDEKLGYDSISKVGPGGDFFTDDLTMKLLRSDEFFHNDCFNMFGRYENNTKDMYERAHEKVNETVSSHKPALDGKIFEAIEKYFYKLYSTKEARERT